LLKIQSKNAKCKMQNETTEIQNRCLPAGRQSSNAKSNPCPRQAGKIQMTKGFELSALSFDPPSLELRSGRV